jgi:hypothetical protein
VGYRRSGRHTLFLTGETGQIKINTPSFNRLKNDELEDNNCNGTRNHSGSTEAYLETCQDIRRNIITYIWKDRDILGKTEIYLGRYIWRDGDTYGRMEL